MAAATRSILVGTGIARVTGTAPPRPPWLPPRWRPCPETASSSGSGLLQSKRLVEELHGTTYGGLGAMRQTIHVVRQLLAGEAVTFDGQAVRIEGRRLAFPPRPPVPDPHGGPRAPHARTLRRGRRRPPRLVLLAALPRPGREAAPRCGRPPDRSLPRRLRPDVDAAFSVSDDPGARDLMRPYVATYLTAGWSSYDHVAEVSGFGQAAGDLRAGPSTPATSTRSQAR